MLRRSLLGSAPVLMFPSIARAADDEIKIGNIMPYSGPASSLSEVGKAEAAYMKMLNDRGGINKRRINFITLDDSYSPPKAVEHARRLVEQDNVALMFSPLGTPSISATIKYFNDRKVPHLFAVSGVSRFSDPKLYPYTPSSSSRSDPTARSLSSTRTTIWAKTISPACAASSRRATTPVSWASYELTDPTVESQVIGLKASGAEILLVAGTPKFASQAIRKAYDIDWKAMIILNYPSSSVIGTLQPAGFEKSIGVITGAVSKDPDDPRLAKDPAVADYRAFMAKYMPASNPSDSAIVFGYNLAMALEHVLKQCGDDFGRENIMKQALNIKQLALPMTPPGLLIDTSLANHQMLTQLQLQRWNGKSFDVMGDVISGAGD
jgi:ABC-type branched-subunit amino acid transport system substrate-binding protein